MYQVSELKNDDVRCDKKSCTQSIFNRDMGSNHTNVRHGSLVTGDLNSPLYGFIIFVIVSLTHFGNAVHTGFKINNQYYLIIQIKMDAC